MLFENMSSQDYPRIAMEISKLVEIMARLRDPEKGCPWDLVQTSKTLKAFLIEEAYEVAEAIEEDNANAICEELGDLLFQIVFQARILEEQNKFTMGDVINGIAEKMIRRHPHIFGEVHAETPEEVRVNWERIKQEEKCKNGNHSVLSGTPKSMPALLRALRITQKAGEVGFDWENPQQVLEKVEEEIGEIKEVLQDKDKLYHEIGDLLFAIVNLARHLDINPEEALHSATNRFVRRFNFIEEHIRKNDKKLCDSDIEELEKLWEIAKKLGY